MQKKTLLLASFVSEDKIDFFINKLKKKFNIKKENVFFFKTETNDLILTYKLFLDVDERLDIKKELPKTIQIHKKGATMFTINALNRLIEHESGLQGNVNHKEYNVDWQKFENKIILLKDNVLDICMVERIFLS